MKKSLICEADKDAVRREYDSSSAAASDFEKMKWGSHASMVNRFDLARRIVRWPSVETWLDIGCGTGLMFETLEAAGHRFHHLAGLDVSPEMISQAKSRKLASPVTFQVGDGGAIPDDFAGRFDLVSMVGILQKCGSSPQEILTSAFATLKAGGQFFLTTKNLNWSAFREGGLTPEEEHSWFDHGELLALILSLGATIHLTNGFLPTENKIVPIEDSHTLFILAEVT